MGRLKSIGPRIASIPSRLGYATGDEAARHRHRDATQSWRSWYKTARWQKLRWSILVRDLFRCRKCDHIVADTSRLVADHIVPHRGDERLFWDEKNLQTLCKDCHDRVKQSEERRATR